MNRLRDLKSWLADSVRWRHRVLIALGLLVSAASVSVLRVYQTVHTPWKHTYANRVFNVSQGVTSKQIYNQLLENSLLPASMKVKLWFRIKASTNTLKAGDYLFPSPIAPATVIEKLIRGDVHHQFITLPEGLNRIEVAHLIQTLNLRDADKSLELTENPDLINLIKDLDPQATTLEGYLFPDTYQYISTTTAPQLMANMIRRFRQVFTPALQRRAEELGMSARQVITLASMIELEARLADERPLVSSVYHNRLRLGMKLDCDPTVIYASRLAGKWTGTIRQSDLRRDSPYNTYLRAGLPPGPVASPGRASIEAALYPADTDHLYFVVDATRDDGAHRFSARFKLHQSNVALYRLAQRRRAKQTQTVTP